MQEEVAPKQGLSDHFAIARPAIWSYDVRDISALRRKTIIP